MEQVNIIGGGLAGSEAAWQLVRRNIPVNIYEMRPYKQTPAHKTGDFAELVCSNSLRAQGLTNAVGLLKEEMRRLDSLIMNCADYHSLPAGGALAVDREAFAQSVTRRLAEHPLVTIHRQEITQLPSEGITILATGPLTSPALTEHLMQITNMEQLYFYDAAAPIVTVESLDMAEGFWGSRYDKGDKDYFNCPMTKEQYMDFYEALISAKVTRPGILKRKFSLRAVCRWKFWPPVGRRPCCLVPLSRWGFRIRVNNSGLSQLCSCARMMEPVH